MHAPKELVYNLISPLSRSGLRSVLVSREESCVNTVMFAIEIVRLKGKHIGAYRTRSPTMDGIMCVMFTLITFPVKTKIFAG